MKKEVTIWEMREGQSTVLKDYDGVLYYKGDDAEKQPKEKDVKDYDRAPNNTALFLNWVNADGIKEFELEHCLKANKALTSEALAKIVSYQVGQGSLTQLTNTRFRVR